MPISTECPECGGDRCAPVSQAYDLLHCLDCGAHFEEDELEVKPRRQLKTKLRHTDT